MSYCRFAWGGSDVYVYESRDGIECCGCRFGKNFTAGKEEDMIAHLALHRRAGHFVPEYAVTGLWEAIPGATKPAEPEPLGLTISSLVLTRAMLEDRIEKLQKAKEAKDAQEKSGS